VEQTINTHHALGVGVVKLPFTSEPTLNDTQVMQAVQTAKGLGMPTVAHALSNSQALRAANLGIDALAHTPTAPCTSETLSLWEDKYVISTLNAFGSISAISNLEQLHQLGAKVLYGTDLGNAQETGISLSELVLLQQAGMSNEEIILSGTALPADFWGFSDLGRIEVGYRASFLILDADPLEDLSTLSRPIEVWIDGIKR
jgi:imidazolonepropionase-like amidohydrolase